MIELLGLIAMIFAFTGVYLNNRKRRACFWFFLAGNSLSLVIHLYAGFVEGAAVKAICLRDAGFIYLSIEGLKLWRKP